MKTLIILRHGKAENNAVGGDRRRALAERGRRDAAAMGALIGSKVGVPDLIVSSDAMRAKETAEIAGEAAGYKQAIVFEPAIYDATDDTLLALVKKLPNSADCVLLVGHNPGFESISAELATDWEEPPRLPTAGFVQLQFATDRWQNARPGTGKLVSLHWPKEDQES